MSVEAGTTIPEPEDTGVVSTQSKPVETLIVVPAEDSAPKYTLLSDTVLEFGNRGVNAAHIRLLAYGARQMEEQIRELKEERKRLIDDLALTRDTQHKAERRADRLDERIRSRQTTGHVTAITHTIGGVILGAATQQTMASPNALSWAGLIIGALLILCGWLPGLRDIFGNKKVS